MLGPDPPSDDEVRLGVIAAMLARRSIREGFDRQPVPGSVLREIVRCGLAAPSSKNAQPWRMHVVADRATLGVLREVAAAIFMENRGLFSNGRAGLIGATRPALAGSLVGFGLEMIGIGAAIENMWLAAEALGVRVAFMGDVVIAEDDICATLGIVGDLAGVLALGFSDVPLPPRRQHLDEQDADHVVWHRPAR